MKHRKNRLLKQSRSLIVDKKAVLRGFSHLFLLGFFFTLPILFYVWTRLEVVRLNYVLVDIAKEERRLFMKNEKYKVELAMLMSPSKLSFMAKKKFQLKSPSQHQIIYMK